MARAARLEQALGTPARICFKDESGSPVGSHKSNTAVAQAFYNARDGVGRLTTETGAGQWGHYSLGSVLNHVLLHQMVIGLEAREQLTLAGCGCPDVVIAPCGGGSDFVPPSVHAGGRRCVSC